MMFVRRKYEVNALMKLAPDVIAEIIFKFKNSSVGNFVKYIHHFEN